MRLKRWESPRRQGRNDKGKGGAARKRQLKKQQQMLRKRLKGDNKQDNGNNNRQGGRTINLLPIFFANFYLMRNKVYLIQLFKSSVFYVVNQYTCIIRLVAFNV